tara:strand:+ start:617 stop:862 length:246 start_codon:yes stop_codon:yes gene_type:complete
MSETSEIAKRVEKMAEEARNLESLLDTAIDLEMRIEEFVSDLKYHGFIEPHGWLTWMMSAIQQDIEADLEPIREAVRRVMG